MKPSRMRRHIHTPNAAVALLDAAWQERANSNRKMMRACALEAIWWIRRNIKPRQTTFGF